MPQKYFQVIPLYLRDDDAVVRYFNDYRSEIDAVTKGILEVALPHPVITCDAESVVSATDSKRYSGLKVDDLPCLWVEGADDHLIVHLHNNADEVKQAIRELSDSAKAANTFSELKENYMAKQLAADGSGQKTPAWFGIAGYVAGLLILVFLMALVVAGIMGHDVRCNTRMLVVFAVSVGLALASAFIGGDQAAKGSLPFPFAKDRPIAFTVTAGIAVFVVALLLGYYTYAKDCKDTPGSSSSEPEGQVTVAGRVEDSNTFTPLRGAMVNIAGYGSPTPTDSNGNFYMKFRTRVAGEPIRVHIDKDGYESGDVSFMPAIDPLEILMKPQTNTPAKEVPPEAPSEPKTIELSATDNTCSFRDGADFVSQKTEFRVKAICTGLSPNYQFTARFSGVIKPDNPHQVPGLPLSTWVDVWLTDSQKGTKAVGQPNFTRRINDDYIRPHDTTLTGEVPASGKVTVYLVLDHCQTWTYETTCTTVGNSHLLVTAAPKT